MKLLFLIVNRLQQYYKKNKVIFLLFVMGGIFNAIMLCYFYGNILPTVTNRDSQDVSYRKYTAQFKEASYGNYSDLEALAQNPLISATSASGSLSGGSKALLFRTFSGDYPVSLLTGRKVFTGPYQVIVPYTCLSALGSSISLGGTSFEIVGKSTDPDCYIIPNEAFSGLGIPNCITSVEVIASERQSLVDDPILDLMYTTFPNSTYIRSELEASNKYAMEDNANYAPQILVSYLVISIAYMFLLGYLANFMAHENIISRLVGAAKTDIATLVFWETAILSLGVSAVGLLLHKLLYVPLFSKLNVAENINYYLSDYLIMYLFIFAVSLVTSIPHTAKCLLLTPVAAQREHT